MKLYNTLTRSIEEFEPMDGKTVKMYACGPTVYDYSHIGHMRKYIGDDILRRTFVLNGWDVNHVMNITDVGHLSSDSDTGEDKLEKGAQKFGKTVLELAKFFEEDFLKSIEKENVLKPTTIARATEHIPDQIALIEELVEKGFTYITKQAIYFDVSKFPEYTKLSKQDLDDKITGAREEVVVDHAKKQPADFALWFFTVGRFENHVLHWTSPWGEGFPGWHVECSAMAMRYLGPTLDVHTGGVDHISIHHTNEIAQSECATGQDFVKFWIHHEFLRVDEKKMSKSLGNIYTITDVTNKGFTPLAFRYLTFQTHYRAEMNFTWESLKGAATALEKLYAAAGEFDTIHKDADVDYFGRFKDSLSQDLNMPRAIAIMWEMLRSKISEDIKAATLRDMDQVLGLDIFANAKKRLTVPHSVLEMAQERDYLRRNKQFTQSDHMRNKIEKMGYIVRDVMEGKKKKTVVVKKV